MLNLILKRMDG